MGDFANKILALDPSPWHYHEVIFTYLIGIKATESESVHERLSRYIKELRDGKGSATGYGRKDAFETGPIDVFDTMCENSLNLFATSHGCTEAFKTCSLSNKNTVKKKPRYFCIGTDTVPVRNQLILVRNVTGRDAKVGDSTAEWRKTAWLDWYHNGMRYSELFQNKEVPDIARKFHNMFGISKWDVLHKSDLERIGNEIKVALWRSNYVPLRRGVSIATRGLNSASATGHGNQSDCGTSDHSSLDKNFDNPSELIALIDGKEVLIVLLFFYLVNIFL